MVEMQYVNSKTTFVTVNLCCIQMQAMYLKNSKTTFVTVNPDRVNQAIQKTTEFKNNFCYC